MDDRTERLPADRRFDGAITRPGAGAEPADASIVPAPTRPRRPLLIETAAAILIVGGLTSILGSLGTLDPATGVLDVLFILLAVLTVIVGLLVRAGRWWILDINIVAVVLFLEATALPSAVAIIFVTLDTIVLYALIRHRAWFERADPLAASTDTRA
ncbi:MAG TPA: hypothetical protein VFI69_01645 [Candidatus Limnocylindrales bacterium]|nr:hypothetical protein [Candidatus Limnocylindrales bacterium]